MKPQVFQEVASSRGTPYKVESARIDAVEGLTYFVYEIFNSSDPIWKAVKSCYDASSASPPGFSLWVTKFAKRQIGEKLVDFDGIGGIRDVFENRGIVVSKGSMPSPNFFVGTSSVIEMEPVVATNPTTLTTSSNKSWNENGFPYVSKVGLYDNERKLVAVAAPSTPVRLSDRTPISFLCRFDL